MSANEQGPNSFGELFMQRFLLLARSSCKYQSTSVHSFFFKVASKVSQEKGITDDIIVSIMFRADGA